MRQRISWLHYASEGATGIWINEWIMYVKTEKLFQKLKGKTYESSKTCFSTRKTLLTYAILLCFSISQLHMAAKHISVSYVSGAEIYNFYICLCSRCYIERTIYFVFIYSHMSIYFFIPHIFPFIITYSLWITPYLYKWFLPGWCNEV